jgi:two-component system, sensor histidine kinase and response regulator
MKILIIEDQPDIRATLRDLLEINGHEVLEAEDGLQGVQQAARQPDFIFCDMKMPHLDGRGVLAAVKEMPGVRDVPFVFLTAQAERHELREGMALGADDYITKPFTEDDLVKAIAARTGRQQDVRERIQQLTAHQEHAAGAQWSHELLTPLNAILGSLDLIDAEVDTIDRQELKEVLALIRTGAVRQEQLSRKLIRYFHLEQLALAPPAAPPARSEAAAVVPEGAHQGVQAHGRGADLKVSAAPGALGVAGDNLRHAIAEIAGNAATFSPPGTPITVTGTLNEGRYRIEITDRGPGMTAAQRAQIGAFVQFDRKVREQQGLGLGLAIARAAAKVAGGNLELHEGDSGTGLRVVFDLPAVPN